MGVAQDRKEEKEAQKVNMAYLKKIITKIEGIESERQYDLIMAIKHLIMGEAANNIKK